MMDKIQRDHYWMHQALELAERAKDEGEVPVGAILVLDDQVVGRGWNRTIGCHDATHHAEIMALREAGQRVSNYRLTNTTLYVTLEPCPMCAGALVHARIKRLVYGARDPKTGAAGSVFNLTRSDKLNHLIDVESGVCGDMCSQRLSEFFRQRRHAIKMAKKLRQERDS
jgi:tRNA(adenine34) deaminase